jgi:hypothetical protein
MLLLLRSLLDVGGVVPPVVEPTYSAEVELKRWYVRRGKQLLIFNNGQEADDYLEAQEQAEKAIAEAQKTSRRARQRLRNKIVTVKPVDTVDVDQLSQAIQSYQIPASLPALIAASDMQQLMQVMALAREMQDEEEVELLLLA